MSKIQMNRPDIIHYESVREFPNSIFGDVYRDAMANIKEIVKNNTSPKGGPGFDVRGTDIRNQEQVYNIISFVGDRGTGKTSAMLSFMEHLKDHYRLVHSGRISDEEQSYMLNDSDNKAIMFTGLEYIDASMIGNKEDLFGIVLSKMLGKLHFEEAQSMYGKGIVQGHDFEYKKRQLNLQFNEVYKCIKELRSKNDITETESDMFLDTIEKLSMSGNLKSAFQKLVYLYLDIMKYPGVNGYGELDSYLIISIDDLDMNIPNGYQMLEQIRKYLMLPNVIVLLSINYKQIAKICQEHFLRDFDKLAKIGQNSVYIDELVKEYLEKIIPEYRQVYMPTVEKFGSAPLEVMDFETKEFIAEKGIPQFVFGRISQILNIQEYTENAKNHFLVPDTLRRLNSFAYSTGKMKKLNNAMEAAEYLSAYHKNYQWFLEVYIKERQARILTEEEQKLIYDISNTEMKEQIRNLCQYFKEKNNGLYQRAIHSSDGHNERKKDRDHEKFGELLEVMSEFGKDRRYRLLVEYLTAYLSVKISKDKEEYERNKNTLFIAEEYTGGSIWGIWDRDVFPSTSMKDSAETPAKTRIGRIRDIELSKDFSLKFESTFIPNDKSSIIKFYNGQKNAIINYQYLLLLLDSCNPKIKATLKDINLTSGKSIDWGNVKANYSISNFIFSLYRPNVLLDEFERLIFEELFSKDVLKFLDDKYKGKIKNELSIKNQIKEWNENYNNAPVIPFQNLDFMTHLQKRITKECSNSGIDLSDSESFSNLFKKYFKIIRDELSKLEEQYPESTFKFTKIYDDCPFIKKALSDDKASKTTDDFYECFHKFITQNAKPYETDIEV